MKMPGKLSTWFLVVYFVLVGLGSFVSLGIPGWVMGVIALGAGITLFLGR